MKINSFERQQGFSVIELLLVIMVIGILTSLAVFNFDRAKVSLQRQNIAQQIKGDLERAKFDSIKRHADANAQSTFTLKNASSFALLIDSNQDGSLTAAESQIFDFSQSENRIVGSNLVFPITFSFDQNGHVTAIDGNNAAVNPTFTVCSKECGVNQNRSAQNLTLIALSATGTVIVEPGGSALLQPLNPTVSSVNTDSGINKNGSVSSR